MKKKLNTSLSTFKNIVLEGYMYVDKTKELYKLIKESRGQYFLSRPRRFGKSLTLSTLEAVFNGEKELFKGLYIYDQPFEWKKHPIIKLRLNAMSSTTAEALEQKLSWAIDRIAKKHEIKLITTGASAKFQELIAELYDKEGDVVILIDEYDKPILDNVLNRDEVLKIRTLLKGFYGIIKAMEEYLRFTFLTGVSKFSQVSVFSDLNNLDDITMHTEFATICGFTQEECELYFAEWIEENPAKLGMSESEYLDKLRDLYNGFRFTKKEITVYNPVSFTKSMDRASFDHFWFETGTPTFLLKLLKEQDYDIIEFEGLTLKSSSFSTYEVDDLSIEALLYQTGYLTIKDYNPDSDLYTLSYPNREVKDAFLDYLIQYFTYVSKSKAPVLIEKFRKAMREGNLDDAFEVLNVFYAKIDNSIKIKHEKYYQTVFYLFFTMLGYRIGVEENTNKGRMDAIVYTDDAIYIFEFKLDKSAKEAIEQIKEREYFAKYKLDKRKLLLIGVNFTSQTGEIEEWTTETLEKAYCD